MATNSTKSILGTLYLVPNTLGEINRVSQLPKVIPIENLRYIAGLKNWVVEDAKTTRAFLNAVNEIEPLKHSLQSMVMQEWRGSQSKHPLSLKPKDLLSPLCQGEDIGLISEAGLPGIADPGAEIVHMAHQLGATVKPLVGPSSILLGLMASGLNGQHFRFLGYLPVDLMARKKKLGEIEQHARHHHETQIWIETPYRNTSMLQTCLEVLSAQTQLCLAVDLTLETEWIWTAPILDWRKRFTNHDAMNSAFKNRPALFLILA
jgi:16S rRNA (cytidine1402-2'-O)-methyltransferase